jgi:hypothetical protein
MHRCSARREISLSRALVHLIRRHETVAAARGGDFQVQRGVLRVAALVDHRLRGLPLGANLNEFALGAVMLAKVLAKTALTFVNLKHDKLLCVKMSVFYFVSLRSEWGEKACRTSLIYLLRLCLDR